jgi:hypothetical protein
MTTATSRTIARIAIASAGVAAATVVLSRPELRRLAARLIRVWLGTSVPLYMLVEVGRAWAESGTSNARRVAPLSR